MFDLFFFFFICIVRENLYILVLVLNFYLYYLFLVHMMILNFDLIFPVGQYSMGVTQ